MLGQTLFGFPCINQLDWQKLSSAEMNKIVSQNDTDRCSQKYVVYAFLFVPKLDLVFILDFLSVNNYLQMLSSELDFASFQAKNQLDISMELGKK